MPEHKSGEERLDVKRLNADEIAQMHFLTFSDTSAENVQRLILSHAVLEAQLAEAERQEKELRDALRESHGSYNSLRATLRGIGESRNIPALVALAKQADKWDGPLCARAALQDHLQEEK